MNPRTQRLCAWCGPAMMVFWAVGFALFAGFVPPPSPEDSPRALAETIRDDTDAIRFGLILTVLGSALLAPFIGVISVNMKRIEGRQSPLTYAQLVLGACLILEFIFPMMILQTAAFRPDQAEETIRVLDDLCWIWFFGIASTVVLEAIVFGIVMLQDHRADPLFPRWAGYFNIWAGLLFSPGTALVFFKDGPLAWDGLFVFWMPIGVFTVWMAVNTTLMIRAAASPETAPPQGPARPDVDERIDHLTEELADLRRELARVSPAG